MPVAEVAENKRFCSQCGRAVGRSRNGQPARAEGFCPGCRTRFIFLPKLHAGDLVAGQYEVLGVLAHGGLGWIYLARDRAVSDRWVVLKGLLDASSEDAAVAAVAERQFLAALDHPNIVRIYNFVTHEGAGYIVMEYVGGKSLKELLKERRAAKGGEIHPLPVDQAVAYALGTLPAMGYFHTQGLVYCDMKPDNVVLTGDGLRIIDLGGVRRIDDDEGAIYGTTGYQAPEVADLGPSPASDLYTIGRMLAVLIIDFRGYQGTYLHSLPPAGEHPVLAEHESLHRFLVKATAPDPEDRYQSAEEMSEQLLGILREEAAAKGQAQPAVSTVFGPDGVVGGGVEEEVTPDWRLLPQPKVDTDDPGVGFLLGLADSDPATVVATLTAALRDGTVPLSPEPLLRLARAQTETGDPAGADATLDTLGDVRDWRVWWQRGLRALSEGQGAEAVAWLDPVYTDLPGELAVKLGLGLAYEVAGDLARAAELYDVASRTDPSYVSGAFGLARVRMAAGDREGAVEALARVPAASSMHVAARVAAVRALASPARRGSITAPPAAGQLERASRILDQLYLDPRRRGLMTCELYESSLAALEGGATARGGTVFGRPLTEPSMRKGLESELRQLARLAATVRERNELVDRANKVRRRTLL
jgi:serine/threonine-protein kinase PknG